MYKLYYYPLNASMAPHMVLEALAVEYELVLVDRKSNAQKSADYLALNPAGRIPTLVDGDLVLFESAAICIYLAEQNPSADLIPCVDSAQRARFFQWMMYLTNTLQAELMIYFYPENHVTDSQNHKDVVANQEMRISDILGILDETLKDQNFLIGDKLSVCDYFLFMLAVWADELKRPPLSFNNLARYLRNMAKQEAVVRVCQKENLSLDDYQ